MEPVDGTRRAGQGTVAFGPGVGREGENSMPRAVTVMRSTLLRPFLVALLCALVGGSATLAAEPAPTPAPVATPAPEVTPEPGATAAPEGTPAPAATPSQEATGTLDPAAAPYVTAAPTSLPSPAGLADADGWVIVVLRSGADPTAAASRARGLGARVERTFDRVVQGYAAQVSPDELRRLAADPRVVAVVPDERITAGEALAGQSVPNGVSRVFGPTSAAAAIDGIDQRVDADVAIFDTGIDPTHPDLAVAGGYNCTSSDRADWIDEEGHGTHVAGTVGALDNGDRRRRRRAGRAAVGGSHPRRQGRGSPLVVDLRPRLDRRPRTDPANPSPPLIEAVNMSVTRWGADDGNCGNDEQGPPPPGRSAASSPGASRWWPRPRTTPASASHRVPAAYNEVITVSALADTDGQAGRPRAVRPAGAGAATTRTTRSPTSRTTAATSTSSRPGKCIYSTKRGQTYGYSSGTSMAAPHVTGAAALYLATRPAPALRGPVGAPATSGNLDWKTSTDPDGNPDILLDVSRIGPLGDFAPSAALPAGGLRRRRDRGRRGQSRSRSAGARTSSSRSRSASPARRRR